jgi:hypothetical protein
MPEQPFDDFDAELQCEDVYGEELPPEERAEVLAALGEQDGR